MTQSSVLHMVESIDMSLGSVRDMADTENTSTDVTNNNKMFRVPSDVVLLRLCRSFRQEWSNKPVLTRWVQKSQPIFN